MSPLQRCPIYVERRIDSDSKVAAVSLFNTLRVGLRCPRCERDGVVEVEIKFGLRNQIEYRLGETYLWTRSPLERSGGRPPGGNLDGEGYAQCEQCRKDFFVVVKLRNDSIESVDLDPTKVPLIP